MTNILIVEDEKAIADLLEVYLKNENYNVIKYYSSTDVVRDIDNLKIDLAILDVMMPEVDGFKLCSIIRKKYNFPIIFATARVEDIDKIKGLNVGADDYITKPFEPLELIARVNSNLRRYSQILKLKQGYKEEIQQEILIAILLFHILFQFQHVFIEVRHKQPILNNTIFFKFSFSFCFSNLGSDFTCILKNLSVISHQE